MRRNVLNNIDGSKLRCGALAKAIRTRCHTANKIDGQDQPQDDITDAHSSLSLAKKIPPHLT